MYFSFAINQPGLERTIFLFERSAMDANGDLETGFLECAGPVTRHRGAAIGPLIERLSTSPDIDTLAVSRNPSLVLDPGLPGRVAEGLRALNPLTGRWSLAAAGGLTPNGARVCALYSSETPFIPVHTAPQPLVDPLPDLYLLDAAYLRGLTERGRVLTDNGLETAIAVQGYLDGRAALYAPALTAGIDGALRPRDPVKLRLDLDDWFTDSLAGESIPTLMGPVEIAPHRPADPRAPAAHQCLAEATERVIDALCDPLSLSIVTRTRFDRPHLLERLLTSITRARRDNATIEVVLSSDAPRETCRKAVAELKAKFVNLTLRLQHNVASGHSRVTNLIGGLRAARGDHVAIMDDDDYVDLFAIEEISRALFLGARPLMVSGSQVHDEEWIETSGGRYILARSTERMIYPAAGWRRMFNGVNQLPVCALVMPRDRLLARLDAFEFQHDLSEDYALFLLVLTDPELPEIVELPGVFGHISLRASDSHSISMADRRPWTRDIALYLASMTRAQSVAGPGKWALLGEAGGEHKTATAAIDAKTIAELRSGLERREHQIRLMQREIDHLRAVESRPEPMLRAIPSSASGPAELPTVGIRPAEKASA